jgi:hypothetical protein
MGHPLYRWRVKGNHRQVNSRDLTLQCLLQEGKFEKFMYHQKLGFSKQQNAELQLIRLY